MNEDEQQVRKTILFENFSGDDVFQAMLDGIAAELVKTPKQRGFDWKKTLVPRTCRALGFSQSSLNEQFYASQHYSIFQHADFLKLQAAVLRLVSLGYVVPRGRFENGSGELIFTSVTLTERGFQACQAVPDGPHRAGYLHQDASDCLDADLFRPAIVMIGIAAEVTTQQAFDATKRLSITSAKDGQFKDQLKAVRDSLSNWLGTSTVGTSVGDERHRLTMALDAIETFRVLRNDSAHAGNPSVHPFQARERFGSACFHLPVVWELLILPNLSP